VKDQKEVQAMHKDLPTRIPEVGEAFCKNMPDPGKKAITGDNRCPRPG